MERSQALTVNQGFFQVALPSECGGFSLETEHLSTFTVALFLAVDASLFPSDTASAVAANELSQLSNEKY